VKRSSSAPTRAIVWFATRRANSAGGSGRLITMTFTPTGISSSPVANAARASAEPPASWRLSSTTTLPAGMRAKS
jgi:hypothetical protein